MDSSQVYKSFLCVALLGIALGVSACTEAEIQECIAAGVPVAICEAGGIGTVGGGGGDAPAENADNSQ